MKSWMITLFIVGSVLLLLAVQGCSSVGGTVSKSFYISGEVETNTTVEQTSRQ